MHLSHVQDYYNTTFNPSALSFNRPYLLTSIGRLRNTGAGYNALDFSISTLSTCYTTSLRVVGVSGNMT